MNPADRQSIEHFVRGTLGCHCPDDVFQSIAIERVPTPRHALPHTRLVIGERLLIHVFEAQPAKATAAAISKPTTQGRTERDAKHYNRYRLVLASDHPIQLLDDARTSFESVAGTDNRTHLHILATDQLPEAIRLKSSAKVSGTGQAPQRSGLRAAAIRRTGFVLPTPRGVQGR
jgi:hypothetical protein